MNICKMLKQQMYCRGLDELNLRGGGCDPRKSLFKSLLWFTRWIFGFCWGKNSWSSFQAWLLLVLKLFWQGLFWALPPSPLSFSRLLLCLVTLNAGPRSKDLVFIWPGVHNIRINKMLAVYSVLPDLWVCQEMLPFSELLVTACTFAEISALAVFWHRQQWKHSLYWPQLLRL